MRTAPCTSRRQLTNILRDADEDASEGRHYLPPGVDRARIFALARDDLEAASHYVDLMRAGSAPPGILAFPEFPLDLAVATLERVEIEGPGAKVSRAEVEHLLARLRKRCLQPG